MDDVLPMLHTAPLGSVAVRVHGLIACGVAQGDVEWAVMVRQAQREAAAATSSATASREVVLLRLTLYPQLGAACLEKVGRREGSDVCVAVGWSREGLHG